MSNERKESMQSTYEIIEYNANFPVKLFFQRIGHISNHWHDSIELLFVLSGNVTVVIESEISELSEGDLILINYNQIHETYSTDCTLLSLQLQLSMFHLDWLTPKHIAFSCNSSKENDKERYRTLKQYLALLVNNHLSHHAKNELLDYSYCYCLMNELVVHFSSSSDFYKMRSPESMQKMGEILHFIESHYTEKVTLSSAAQSLFLSPSYLAHFFESKTGSTFFNYLNNYRLERSLEDLFNPACSLTDVAEKNGFASTRAYSDFFRKKYDMLPSQFRKNYAATHKNFSIQKVSDSYLELEKNKCMTAIANYLPQNTPQAIPVICQTAFIQPVSIDQSCPLLKHTFRNFCSIGRALDILYTDNDKLLSRIQQEIGFRYIKFHGIFDDDLHVYQEDDNGNALYNFYYTDKVLKKLLSFGLKPMIEFSFMPYALAKDKEATCSIVNFNISEPKSDEKWEALVQSFTSHCVQIFGRTEVRSWIFTFWNETLTNQVFRFENDEIFFRLYKKTFDAVKSVDSGIPFATTSFTCTIFPTRRYENYLSFMEKNHCTADLFLFHFYATAENFDRNLEKYDKEFVRKYGTTIPLTLSTDIDLMHNYFSDIKNTLRPKFEQPVYLTEWGFSPSHREPLNDTVFASCYIIRNILQNYDSIESFCHWNLTDQIDELEEPEQTFHGGTGLFTRNGLAKPSYYAYVFLTKLQDYLLSSGDGYFLTTNKERNRLTLLLYHYEHFSDMYADGILFESDTADPYSAFTQAEKKKFSICVTGLSSDSCISEETILNRNSGSIYDKWISFGGIEPLTDEDISILKNLSTPEKHKKICTIENGKLLIEAVLEPLEVRLIQIQLQ